MGTGMWAKHYQRGWENKSANPNTPLWARIASLAYARHGANGHAVFERGSLSWILGTPPKDGKLFKKRDSATIRDAIKVAVQYGWLAEGSCNECLIVPSHDISMPLGNESKPCPVHERKNAQKRAKRRTSAA
ncbi:hypothetical protein [Mycobacteroides chelonae]|uniref:hypothetical protein n=1 Tax=Mycobacteroides chelonae TaxID=1774 RepID=UPI0012FF61A6|nr:hypothetical protein [Mycobacteroides chelonae]